MSIKRSTVNYQLHTCNWTISHVYISGWVFLLLGFLLVIIWRNLIVIFQNLPPLCLILTKTWGNVKVQALDCFISWSHILTVRAVWKFICSLCSAGVLLSPAAFAVNVRKVISTYWVSLASMTRSHQPTSVAQGPLVVARIRYFKGELIAVCSWACMLLFLKDASWCKHEFSKAV